MDSPGRQSFDRGVPCHYADLFIVTRIFGTPIVVIRNATTCRRIQKDAPDSRHNSRTHLGTGCRSAELSYLSAECGTRTHTPSRAPAPKASVSANSTNSAHRRLRAVYHQVYPTVRLTRRERMNRGTDLRITGRHVARPDDLRDLVRSVITIGLTRISDSCGFVVPQMEFSGDRQHLMQWGERQASRHGNGWKDAFLA